VYHPMPITEEGEVPQVVGSLDVEIQAADGTRLHAWWRPVKGAATAVLFCHGNYGNASHYDGVLDNLAEGLGASALAIDYPGYGRSEGSPSEPGCYAAADAACDWLNAMQQVPSERVVFYGESLGGGVVVDLAGRRPHRALVLVKTFTSLPDVAQ